MPKSSRLHLRDLLGHMTEGIVILGALLGPRLAHLPRAWHLHPLEPQGVECL